MSKQVEGQARTGIDGLDDILGGGLERRRVFLLEGSPGTGKTTAARRIEEEQLALRLSKDPWVKALYGNENPTDATSVSKVCKLQEQ